MNSPTIPCKVEFREELQETEEYAKEVVEKHLKEKPDYVYFGLGGLNKEGMIWHFLSQQIAKARYGQDNFLNSKIMLGPIESFGFRIPIVISASTDNRYYHAKISLDITALKEYGITINDQLAISDIPYQFIDKLTDEFTRYLFQKITGISLESRSSIIQTNLKPEEQKLTTKDTPIEGHRPCSNCKHGVVQRTRYTEDDKIYDSVWICSNPKCNKMYGAFATEPYSTGE